MTILGYDYQKSMDHQKFWEARAFFLKPGVFNSSNHGLRGGDVDDYYFDIDILLNDPQQCAAILDIYETLINELLAEMRIDYLSFIEKEMGGTIGALRLAGALSIKTNLPNLVVRPGKRIAFEKIKMQLKLKSPMASCLKGSNAIVVTDHCTTGAEALDAVKILESFGAKVNYVVSYTMRPDRFEAGEYKSKYDRMGIRIISAYELPCEEQPQDIEDLDRIAINY